MLKTGVWAILSAFAQMSKAIGDVSTSQCFWGYGYTWNWVSYYDDDATISHKLKALTAFEQSLWEKSHANGKRNKTWEEGAGKESESSLFPRPLTAELLTHSFACYWKWPWKDCSQSITIKGNSVCLVFGEPVYIINPKEKFIHIPFFTHFNQYLTINSIAALTRAWLKKSWHTCMRDIPMPKCMLR